MKTNAGDFVNVFLQDGVTKLGPGKVIGKVTALYFKMPDNSLHFWRAIGSGSTIPDKEWVKYLDGIGVKLIEFPDSVAIELSDGRIVYSSQVWFAEGKEAI